MGETPVTFEALRQRWYECAYADDHNSITQQLGNLVLRSAIHQSLVAANSHPAFDEQGEPIQNRLLVEFIQDCFLKTQAAAIRCVFDGNEMAGPKGVWSIGSLVSDLQTHRAVLTRENLTADFDDWYREVREAKVDWLTGVTRDSRSPSDIVREDVLTGLVSQVERSRKAVKAWVDKAIAHPATPASRSHGSFSFGSLTYEEMLRSEEDACRLFAFIHRHFLGDHGLSFLPVVLGDQWQHASEPLIHPQKLSSAQSAWETFDTTTRDWAQGDWQDRWNLGGGAAPSPV